jgi:hypothetical protein
MSTTSARDATRIEVHSALELGFDRAMRAVPVFDEKGRKLGTFIPDHDPIGSCPYSEEELRAATADARANPGQGKTLSQIWKELGQDELSRSVDAGSGRGAHLALDNG